jgi:hypothetical protein
MHAVGSNLQAPKSLHAQSRLYPGGILLICLDFVKLMTSTYKKKEEGRKGYGTMRTVDAGS